MDGVTLTPLQQIHHPKGDLYHAMKCSSPGYKGFGEAYFTTIDNNETKGWKQHTKMTLNLVVPVGSVMFVIYDGESFETHTLSPEHYQRLSIGPGLWVAFKGIGSSLNLILNIADIEHDPDEACNKPLEEIPYGW